MEAEDETLFIFGFEDFVLLLLWLWLFPFLCWVFCGVLDFIGIFFPKKLINFLLNLLSLLELIFLIEVDEPESESELLESESLFELEPESESESSVKSLSSSLSELSYLCSLEDTEGDLLLFLCKFC